MTESFAPQVIVDGVTVTPKGWMWILGFALAGCQWAIDIADKPEFRKQIADYYKEKKTYELTEMITDLENELQDYQKQLKEHLDGK